MNSLFDWLGQPLAQRLGWTLLHFVWQGALLALLHSFARAALHRRSANARYLAGCLTLLLMAAAPLWTLAQWDSSSSAARWTLASPQPHPEPVNPARPAAAVAGQSASGSGLIAVTAQLATATAPWLTLFWLAGVTVLSLRLSAGWLRVRTWQQQAADAFDLKLHARLDELQTRLGVSRPIRLLRSAAVRVPTVAGWFRPVILLPLSALTGLSPRQLDFILAHELAHVRRGDAWVSLFQTLVETLLFYHPAVWWVSRCVREEREHCCDDLALSVCGDRLAGAEALTTLEEIRQWSGGMALAANEGSLLTRVRRLLGLAEGRPDWRRTVGNALLGLGLLALLAGLLGVVMARPVYSASCRLIPPRPSTEAAEPSGSSLSAAAEVRWLRTERELAASTRVLQEVVRRLNLVRRWGLETYSDRELAEQEAARRLRNRLTVSGLEDSYLLEVRVESADSPEAAEIANAVGEAYTQARRARREEAAQAGLMILQEDVSRWTAKVQERQQMVDSKREQLGVSDMTDEAPGAPGSFEREMASSMAQQLALAKAEYVLHRTKLDQLRNMDTNLVRRTILTLLPGEEILPKLLIDLTVVQQELAKLRQDHADEHPTVQKAMRLQATTEDQVNERVSGMIAGLEHYVTALQARVEGLQKYVDDGRERLVAEGRSRRDLSVLQRGLEGEQRVRDALYLRAMQEQVDAKILAPGTAEIVDRAEPPVRPSSRQVPPWTRLAWGGGALCCVGGLGMRAFAGRGRSGPPDTAPSPQTAEPVA